MRTERSLRMSSKQTRVSQYNFLLLLIYLIPVVLVFWFVNRFSVNIPFSDEWRLVNLFDKVYEGNASFSDLFAQNNEHRSLSPLVLVTLLAFGSKWNIRYTQYLGIFLAIVTFLSIYLISKAQLRKVQLRKYSFFNQSLFHITNIFTCVFIFSLIQWEIWLWGWASVMWYLTNACIVIAILLLYMPDIHNNFAIYSRLFMAAVACAIASFSAGYGLLSWVALIPSIIALRGGSTQRILRTILWSILSAIAFTLYTANYQRPNSIDIPFLFKHPRLTADYFFTLLGSPIGSPSPNPIVSTLAGLSAAILFLFLSVYCVRKRKIDAIEVAPWISLGLVAIFFGLLTTLGRASFVLEFPQQALSPRYKTASLLLPVSLAQMGFLFCIVEGNNVFERYKKILVLVTAIATTTIVFILHSYYTLPQGQWFFQSRRNIETCLELVHFMENTPKGCLQTEFSSAQDTVITFSKKLERIGFRSFPKNIEFIETPTEVYGYIEKPKIIEELVRDGDNNEKISGWVMLPKHLDAKPNLVMFSVGEKKKFLASIVVPRQSNGQNSIQPTRSNWMLDLPKKSIPPDAKSIRAWLYNSVQKRFFLLENEIKIADK